MAIPYAKGVSSPHGRIGFLYQRCCLPRLPAPPLTTDGRMRNGAP
ncbi:hypothetical protein ACFYXS_07935 [Streptomyces sp. NPDC002574]